MNIDPRLYVVIGIASTALAQILLKVSGTHTVMQAKWIVTLLLSLVIYAVSFVSYYMALKFFEISKVQPIMMASILSIIALYGFAVGEDLNRLRVAGILLSILSIVLITKS